MVQDLRIEGRVIRYRRERWVTPAGKLIVAPLPAGLRGHFGPDLVRFILLQHHQGQVTSDRITFFATTFSKSRKNFLELLRAGYQDDVINAETLAYMRERHLTGTAIEQLCGHEQKTFADQAAWSQHLDQLGISQLEVHPPNAAIALRSAVKIATKGALFGSIHDHGFLQNTVIVSDGAGQFRLADHALCWVHAERFGRLTRAALTVLHSLHKLNGFNNNQRRALDITRELIWWLYRDLEFYQDDPCRKRAAQLKDRFKRIFSKKTDFVTLDRLLARLLARLLDRMDKLLCVLNRPEIPLHTNGSENDIRCHVIKRKISGETRSEAGRDARNVFLGLIMSSSAS